MRYENRLSQHYHVLLRQNIGCHPNIHRNIELVYLRSGQCTAHIAGRAYPMEPNSLTVVFPNQAHFFEDCGPNECYLLICSPDEFPEYRMIFQDQMPVNPVLHRCTDPEYTRLFELLLQLKEQPIQEEPSFLRGRMRGYALALISAALAELRMTQVVSDALASTVHKILCYCDTGYTQPISLEQASQDLGISVSRICHVFEEKLHISFHHYVSTLRLEQAKELLISTDDTVTQICYSVGFGSVRAFNRQFHRQVGVTPTAYRSTRQAPLDEKTV